VASVNHVRPAPLTTIRPNVFPQQPPVGGQRDEAGRLAAQRAFFAAVSAQAPAAAAAPVAPQAPAQVNRIAQTAPSEAPQRIPRPGSILDIRV
jgi:hypothetical protein